MASTDLSVFLNGAAIPSRHGEVDDLTKSLAGGASYKRISLRGGKFRMYVNGKEVAVSKDDAMNVVIVAAAPKTGRTYYADTYTQGATEAPDCMSIDGEKPADGVKNPQAITCMTCPQNIKGSGQGDSRACRFSRRLAVVLENDMDSGDVYQLTLPAKSLFGIGEAAKMPLEQYAKFLAGHGISVGSVVTELRFDLDSTAPKLTFRAVRPLSDAEFELSKKLGASKDAKSAITYDASTLDTKEPSAEISFESTARIEHVEEEQPVEAPTVPEKKKEAPKPTQQAETEEVAEPVKRSNKKSAQPEAADVASILNSWDDE